MVDTGAIKNSSPHKAEHLRHTSLSIIYYEAPQLMTQHLLNARHTGTASFVSSYHVRLDTESERYYNGIENDSSPATVAGILSR